MAKTKATIPLSKGYDITKISFPCYISEKYDGMPIRLDMGKEVNGKDTLSYLTRQGTQNVSVKADAIKISALTRDFREYGITTMLAEVTHETVTGFKNISGTIRRQEPNDGFIWNFFDFSQEEEEQFYIRKTQLEDLFKFSLINDSKFNLIKQTKCKTVEDLTQFLVDNEIRKDQEGWVIRSFDDLSIPASRSWGYQKIVVTPSEDLKLMKVDEAISKDGDPLGMAGKLWADYNGTIIGVGPGKLTHKERTALWLEWCARKSNWHSPMMEVTYKKDDTYDALREARFTCWRPDKD